MANISLLLIIISVLILSSLFSTVSYAHGYVESPPARAQMYRGNSDMVGSAAWEPQSIGRHQNNGWPFTPQSPSDGFLASADCTRGCPQIDRQSSTLWNKTDIPTGWNDFTWFYTAWHPTASWQFFITKQGWDQNAPLSRESFDLIPIYDEIYQGNQEARQRTTHRVFIPTDRSGYHVIYAAWTTTPGQNNETFYNVIDVNIVNDGSVPPVTPPPVPPPSTPPTDRPTSPIHLHTMDVQSNLVDLMWGLVPTAVRYDIYRGDNQHNMRLIGNSVSNTFIDRDVQGGMQYNYFVVAVDSSGRESYPSNTIIVNTPTVTTPPVQPPSGGETTWNPFARYNAGDIVMYNGRQYQALVTFQGFGDPSWGPSEAHSLWRPL